MIEKEISSERLHYRKITESDGAALHAILSDPSRSLPDIRRWDPRRSFVSFFKI